MFRFSWRSVLNLFNFDNIGQSVIDPQSSRFALLKKIILKY